MSFQLQYKIQLIMNMHINIPYVIFIIYFLFVNQTLTHKVVLQSDHFANYQQTKVNSMVTNVQQGRPLILILKTTEDNNMDLLKNPILAKIEGSNNSKQCSFYSHSKLCIIENVESTKLILNLQCQSTPCFISWEIFQPETNNHIDNDSSQIKNGVYNLENSTRHVIARVFCNDPTIIDFTKQVAIYSDDDFERGGSLQEIYIMFTNKEKGYVYIDISKESLGCAQVKFNNVPQTVNYSNEVIIDFTAEQSSSSILLPPPVYNIKIQCLFRLLKQKNSLNRHISPVNITLFGRQNLYFKQLQNYFMESNGQQEMQFSLLFNNIGNKYKELKLQTTTKSNQVIIFDIVITDLQVQSINLGQPIYYQLGKDENISFNYSSIQDTQDTQLVQITTTKQNQVKTNRTECLEKEGCLFSLTAVKDTKGFVLLKTKQEKLIQFLLIDRMFKKKGKMLQNIYLKKLVQKNKSFRLNINTPNAIMFTSRSDLCSIPSEECAQKTGNIHHPILYTPKQDGQFLIKVSLLQNCQFVVNIISENDQYISLEDGVPFSYTLYEKQQRLEFKYILEDPKEVNFNLIAPLNTLLLTVQNGPESGRQISTEGFLTFTKEQVHNKQFTIAIEKNPVVKNKQVHFTLLVSTDDTVIQLQSTVAHYETIRPETYRQYIFQFISSEQYIINFYTHNIKNHKIKVMLALSIDRSWNRNNLQKIWIDRQSDHIDLNDQANQLCKISGLESCQIFLRLENQMEIEIDMTITLLTRNSVIELKDGIWQSYSQSIVINSAHFYFYPKHNDKNVVLIYHSTTESIKLSYNLWKTDKHNINPLYWPFPNEPTNHQISSLKSVHQVVIDKEVLRQQCWPYCVVLITLYEDYSREQTRWGQGKDIKIMASNNQIQIPEKTRIQMTLKTGQQKDLVVDLKYALSQEQIIFYNTRLFGNYIIFADLYSQKNNRCPLDGKDSSDYVFESGQNIFYVENIQKRMQQLKINKDVSIYMCLSILTETDSKFSIQYTTSIDKIKHVHLDSFQQVTLLQNQTKFYQIEGYYDFTVKIMRKSGFPFVYIKQCPAPQLIDCKSQALSEQNHGQQIVTKTQYFQKQPCKDCVYIFRFSTQQVSSVVLHLKSKYSMIELKEHEILTDFMQVQQKNNYMWTHVTAKPMVVDIHVLAGSMRAILTNGKGQNITKISTESQKLIHFYVEPEKLSKQSKKKLNQNQSLVNSFEYSHTFKNYILLLSNEEHNSSCIYSLVYSSGQSQIYLQDGLITDITLQPGKPRIFFYFKESIHPIYLTISAKNSSYLDSLTITAYYFDANQTQNKIEFSLEKPKLNRHAPSPILIYQLPQKTRFQIILTNNQNEYFPISIGINHQQVMFLPLDHQYPFVVHQTQQLHFVVQINHAGFLEANIRKCDQSSPTFAYTEDYSSFGRGQFDSERTLTDGPVFKETIKVKKADSFYLSFWGTQFQQSHLSITLTFHESIPARNLLRPGGDGGIEYEILQNKRAQLTFIPIKCKKSSCPKQIKYYILASDNEDQLYAKMYCPSAYFISHEDKDSFSSTAVELKSEQDIVDVVYDLREHIQFIGIKAVTDQGEEIFYRPIEVATFWGQLSRTSHSHKVTLAALLSLSVCALLWFVRHNARRGYVKIQEALPSSE